jgi:uncharacterized protein (DUF2062 family)
MNVKRWLREHSLRLLAIRDTPEAIASGVAIGVFFGFMPLFGIKTVSALFLAWLTRSNIIATIIAGTLHDLILPLMPMIYLWEYKVGYYMINEPHHWPEKLRKLKIEGFAWREWRTYFTGVGKPLLVGGVLCSAPFVPISFYITRAIVARHQRKKQEREKLEGTEADPP